MLIDFRRCSSFSSKQLFEQPPCEDGHGDDCLDLACVECGHAIVVGIMTSDDLVVVEHLAA